MYWYFFLVSTSGFAKQKASEDNISVNFKAGEIAFIISKLNNITVSGNEVEEFVEVYKIFTDGYEDLNKKKKSADKIDMSLAQVQNFFVFMQRVKLNGSEALSFNEITKKVLEEVKKTKK